MCCGETIQAVQIELKRDCCYPTVRLYFLLQAWMNTQETEAQTKFRQPFIRKWYID